MTQQLDMNVIVTTFVNPFSFFCKVEKVEDDINFSESNSADQVTSISKGVADFNHGQYVAVMWKEKWVRGIVTMESQFLIWLVDYGIYLRPNDKTTFIDLPAEYRKYPSKVFEASVHGVSPVDKVLTYDCRIKNQVTTNWNKGAIGKAQSLIASAVKKYFVPIAILSTKHNDVVIGDLYLKIENKGIVNIVDELKEWPVFLETDPEAYINNLAVYYSSRRKHRASLMKPEFSNYDIPVLGVETSMKEYNNVCASAPPFELLSEYGVSSEGGSTVVTKVIRKDETDEYKLTPAEIDKYSRMFVTVNDREYNVLNILLNKLRDLRMCDMYKDHDLKRVGRASSRKHSSHQNDDYDD